MRGVHRLSRFGFAKSKGLTSLPRPPYSYFPVVVGGFYVRIHLDGGDAGADAAGFVGGSGYRYRVGVAASGGAAQCAESGAESGVANSWKAVPMETRLPFLVQARNLNPKPQTPNPSSKP